MTGNTICNFCNKEEETTMYLFFNYKISKRIWENAIIGWGLVYGTFNSFYIFDQTVKQNVVWTGIWAVII